MTNGPEGMLRRAMGYARRGWPVLPCQPGGKAPATRHGFHDATTDQELIRWWWRREPMANLAIATGAPGPDVLDIDERGPAGNGFAAYDRLRGAGLLGGAFAAVGTPGGGLHIYFPGSGQASGSMPGQHLDFKARGGYVLAPPSQVDGRPYRLIAEREPQPGGLDWPAATALLQPDRRQAARPGLADRDAGARDTATLRADGGHLAAWVGRLREGNRNAGLFWAACRAVEAGDTQSLDDLTSAATRTGLDDREIARTIASARRTAQQPRRPATGREATL